MGGNTGALFIPNGLKSLRSRLDRLLLNFLRNHQQHKVADAFPLWIDAPRFHSFSHCLPSLLICLTCTDHLLRASGERVNIRPSEQSKPMTIVLYDKLLQAVRAIVFLVWPRVCVNLLYGIVALSTLLPIIISLKLSTHLIHWLGGFWNLFLMAWYW